MMRVRPPETDGRDAVSASALAHQPELLESFQRLYGTLWSHGVVDQPTKEVARLRNARVTGCALCQALRFEGARRQGLGEESVDQIDDGFEASGLSDRHKSVIRYTDVFLKDPGGLGHALQAEMAEQFSPEEIVELTVGLALFMGFSKIAVALGPIPDGIPVMVVPTPDVPA